MLRLDNTAEIPAALIAISGVSSRLKASLSSFGKALKSSCATTIMVEDSGEALRLWHSVCDSWRLWRGSHLV